MGPRGRRFESSIPDTSTRKTRRSELSLPKLVSSPLARSVSATFRQTQSLRLKSMKKSPELAKARIFLSMYYLYILRGPRNHLYVGVTNNISKRIERHKSGDGAEFTKRNEAYELVYSAEFETYLEARKREQQVKGWSRKKKENLIDHGDPRSER